MISLADVRFKTGGETFCID